MRRILISCGLALVAVVPLAGQAGVSEPRGADGKPVTITGCLGGGAPKFVITNVLAARPAGGKDQGSAPVGLLSSYALVPADGVALAPHVGRRVELVGTVIAAAKKEETEPARPGRGGPTAQFAVTAVKMISPVCIE